MYLCNTFLGPWRLRRPAYIYAYVHVGTNARYNLGTSILGDFTYAAMLDPLIAQAGIRAALTHVGKLE